MSAVEDQLAWEAEQRPRATIAAIAGGLLTLLGNVLLASLLRSGPGEEDGLVSTTEALNARLTQGRAPQEPSLLARQVEHYGDRVVPFLLATVLIVTGTVLLGLVLAYLFRALVARLPDVGRLPIVMTVIGTVAFSVGRLVRDGVVFVDAANFDAAGSTADQARDVVQSGTVLSAVTVEQIGQFGLSIAVALMAFHAMRAGLLTRFLGILGVIVGILSIPFLGGLDQLGLLRSLWLLGVGWVAISGRGPRGLLPAWRTGRSEPWPSQQQVREQREAAARQTAPAPARPAKPGGAVPAGADRTKRKRKKRR